MKLEVCQKCFHTTPFRDERCKESTCPLLSSESEHPYNEAGQVGRANTEQGTSEPSSPVPAAPSEKNGEAHRLADFIESSAQLMVRMGSQDGFHKLRPSETDMIVAAPRATEKRKGS